VSFTRLLEAMLLARAPLDLIGMAGGYVADEMHHVELCARVAMELGGAPPVPTDFAGLGAAASPGTPLRRAAELMVRLCCVGEAFSVPMLAGTMAASTHPLTREVLAAILRDEAHHGQLGWLFLDWVTPHLDDEARAHLAAVAMSALVAFAPLWRSVTAEARDDGAVRALGWMPAATYVATARQAVTDDVLAPLARRGIVLPAAEVDALWT
jgi:hypothetical protein